MLITDDFHMKRINSVSRKKFTTEFEKNKNKKKMLNRNLFKWKFQ